MPSAGDDDLTLLEGWRDGDTDAGGRLLERHIPSLYRFFVTKVQGAAEDLAQQTLLECVESSRRYDPTKGTFKGYLFGIARHRLYRYYRRENANPSITDLSSMSAFALSGESPVGAVLAREEQRALVLALRGLPLDAQIALELHYWEDLSAAEIAEVLEIPAGTARSRLFRAQTALRAELQRNTPQPAEEISASDLAQWARTLGADLRGRRS